SSSSTGGGGGAGGEAASAGIGGGIAPSAPCSSDLHSVLDQNGNVIATCADDQGCADGVCIPACEAAAKSGGNLGCDFVIPTPSAPMGDWIPNYANPYCFALMIANAWPGTVKIDVERGGDVFDPSTFGRIPDGTSAVGAWPALPAEGILP